MKNVKNLTIASNNVKIIIRYNIYYGLIWEFKYSKLLFIFFYFSYIQ